MVLGRIVLVFLEWMVVVLNLVSVLLVLLVLVPLLMLLVDLSSVSGQFLFFPRLFISLSSLVD